MPFVDFVWIQKEFTGFNRQSKAKWQRDKEHIEREKKKSAFSEWFRAKWLFIKRNNRNNRERIKMEEHRTRRIRNRNGNGIGDVRWSQPRKGIQRSTIKFVITQKMEEKSKRERKARSFNARTSGSVSDFPYVATVCTEKRRETKRARERASELECRLNSVEQW